ncbi:serine O-acetyltransferase [Clostridium sp. 'White wine YQ']|uniref:serine O-acetyltransferase n=1 Tax=Clostridium sp. 'White wine YQ' TaxID=3027474 RepID=UPI002365FBAB|nr:serine acetyltransferase [Clostridium sp. 'White wine YQ']MDD7794424.1 serine acetyltransferase [Clostridium sp. 'White wine YQ']
MNKDCEKNLINLISEIATSYRQNTVFSVYESANLPNRSEIIEILQELRQLIFPGFFQSKRLTDSTIEYYIGDLLISIQEKLHKQVKLALQYKHKSDYGNDEELIEEKTNKICMTFIKSIPKIQEYIVTDVQAAYDGDPAAGDIEQVIFSYPGVFAISIYRIAHELDKLAVPYIPRIMTEYAHGKTGIDINAGAEIGKYFFIDHGTGVVIGQTCIIGEYVKIYQGVTLGALSTRGGQALEGVRRHPTIEDNVTIYSGATILGGETIIGKNSVIGGNAFITQSVPADTRVSVKNPELKFRNSKPEELKQEFIFDWVI